jgi:ribonuclease VapC
MMLETSAILAVLLNEPERAEFLDAIEKAESPFTTAVALGEAAMALAARTPIAPTTALQTVRAFLDQAGVSVVDFVAAMAEPAVEAREKFGRGRHPAALNFGDCLSYGAARHHRAPLLFKGEDFAQTDIASALPPRARS